jgi:hypothetical protein
MRVSTGVVSVFLFCIGLLPARAVADIRLREYCKDQVVLARIEACLAAAAAEKLPVERLRSRLAEGLLKRVPCLRLAEALDAELARLRTAGRLVWTRRLDGAHLLLLADLAGLGLQDAVLSALLDGYPGDNRIALGEAGRFLAGMRGFGWEPAVLAPIAVALRDRNSDRDRISATMRLLNSGRDLRLRDPETVAVVLEGLRSGRSPSQIRNQLEERRPFH